MGLYDLAKDALKEIPMSDIMRARLELAVDQATTLEKKVADLQTQAGRLQAQLENANSEKEKKDEELRTLREAMKEEVVIHRTAEFRRGRRTGGKWQIFCPKCHLPALANAAGYYFQCSDGDCKFISRLALEDLSMAVHELEQRAEPDASNGVQETRVK